MSKSYLGTYVAYIHGLTNPGRFCLRILGTKHWEKSLQQISFRKIYNFLHWQLSQQTGQNGRLKRPIKSKGSLIRFWCCFRLAYERAAYGKIDLRINSRLVYNVGAPYPWACMSKNVLMLMVIQGMRKLEKEFGLTHRTRENRSMTIDDLKDQLQTTLQTTEKMFNLGEVRILAVLFLLLLAPQGARPASVLQLRFGDIRTLLIRDPTNPEGPPRLVLELSMAYTKEYLGPKAE